MKKVKRILLSILIGVAIGGVLTGSIFGLKIYLQGRLPANVFIADINLSYKTKEESINILNKEIKNYINSGIVVKLKNIKYNINPESLGIEIFPKETINEIKEIDFSKTNLFKVLFVSEKKNLKLLTKIDEEKLTNEMERLFELDKIAPREPIFYFDKTWNLQIKEGKSGLEFNKEKLINDIKSQIENLQTEEVMLELTKKNPIAKKEDLENKKEDVENKLNHTLTLVDPIYSDDWYISISKNKNWLEFETVDKEAKIKIKQKKLDEYVNTEISKWLDIPAQEVKIYKNEENKTIIEGEGNNGLKVQRAILKEKMEDAIENKIEEIIIPVEETKPIITVSQEFKDLGIKEQIGVGHTSYYNSPANRVHNIKTAAAKQNTALIAPDEIFSFNTNLGPVDGSTGYRKELVIKEEGTVPEYGGGVCQVSTTMYRAALFSGLPIVERHEHSYVVSYYSQVLGHGLDATIYLGGPDLKFKNDTGNHILVQAYVKNDYELYFVFYGTSDGREVEMEGPYISGYKYPGSTIYIETDKLKVGETKQVEKAHTGFNVLWYRHLKFADGTKKDEELSTHYRAIPAKILVGTAE